MAKKSMMNRDLKRAAALHGRPRVFSNHRNASVDLDDIAHTGYRFGFGGIKGGCLAAKDRAACHHCK